jgi:ABC-type amino acid transport substrate-binding protein
MPVRKVPIVAGISAVLLLSSGCASMETAPAPRGTLDKIKATRTIALGYRESSVPFSYVGNDKKPTGYSVDLCSRVVADLQRQLQLPDLRATWVPVTPENRIQAVVAGTVDLECGSTTNTLSRQQQVDFSLTTFVTGGSLLALASSNLPPDLRGIRVAVIPGTTTEQVLREALAKGGSSITLIPVREHAEGLTAVEERRADAYASDRVILIGLAAAARDPKRFVLSDRYFSYEPYALMLRRGDPDFRLAVNRVLARIYRSPQIREIYTRWFGALGDPSALLIAMYAIEGLPE